MPRKSARRNEESEAGELNERSERRTVKLLGSLCLPDKLKAKLKRESRKDPRMLLDASVKKKKADCLAAICLLTPLVRQYC
jgi:hypothetical protein